MVNDMRKNDKIGNAVDFIEYISKNMEKEDLLLLYRINNIKKERLEMFSDFIYALNELVITTYMGDDITLGSNRVKHFKWCWDKVVSSFKMEGVYFLETEELYNYFLTFYQESFYEENKEDDKIFMMGVFWDELLNYTNTKTMSEYESLVELYKMFNKSFVVN
jgi:hypothetical protein